MQGNISISLQVQETQPMMAASLWWTFSSVSAFMFASGYAPHHITACPSISCRMPNIHMITDLVLPQSTSLQRCPVTFISLCPANTFAALGYA